MANDEMLLHDRETHDPVDMLRHTTSHVMAHAVTRLFPGTRLAIGPAIDKAITTDDLERIEAEMRKIIKDDIPLVRVDVPRDEAIRRMQDAGQDYKVELIGDIEDDTVSFYQQGDFIDLCRGPHLASTGEAKAFKLLSIAGAYWRGDERRPMLTRIYGTAFPTQDELDEHLHLLEEARLRDHRKLGRALDLYSFHPEGPGFALFHPKGLTLWDQLMGVPPSCCARACGRRAATGTTMARRCTSPRSTATSTASSR